MKKLFLVFLVSFTYLSSLLAQSDDKLKISINADIGGVLSLPLPDKDIFYVPARVRHYIGLLADVNYNRINLQTGIQRFTYPVTMALRDTAVLTGSESSFNSEFTAYHRVPFSLGYVFDLKKSNFTIEPYLTAGMLFSASGISNITSYGNGSLVGPTDTITRSLTHGMQRNKRIAIYGGAGAKLQYRHKKMAYSLKLEYFQALEDWTTLYGVYQRESVKKGSLVASQSFKSRDRNIIFGISVGRYLYH